MKIKNKKTILLIASLILIIIISTIYNSNKNTYDNSIKRLIYNKNKSFTKEQTIKGVTFTNIKCYYNGEDSLISYIITNKTDKEIDLKNYKILVKDKNGTVITNIFIDFSKKLTPKEKMKYKNSVVGVDLSNAYSMELKLEENDK